MTEGEKAGLIIGCIYGVSFLGYCIYKLVECVKRRNRQLDVRQEQEVPNHIDVSINLHNNIPVEPRIELNTFERNNKLVENKENILPKESRLKITKRQEINYEAGSILQMR